jgi:hypothetical protein
MTGMNQATETDHNVRGASRRNRRPFWLTRAFPTLLALVAAAACDSSINGTDVASIALSITYADGGASGNVDQGQVRIEGPTSRGPLQVAPGGTLTIEGLTPGSYTVVLEGLTGGEVETYGERTGVNVVAGSNTTVNVTMNSFIPTFNTVPGEVTAGESVTVTYTGVTGATAYVVEWSNDAGFANAQQTEVSATTATITLADEGTYYVRVRARNRFGLAGVPSTSITVTAGPGITPIAEARGLAVGTVVTVEGVVSWQQPWENRVYFFQDATAGLSTFDETAPQLLIGDVVTVTGEVNVFRGEIQVANITEVRIATPGTPPAPRFVTGSQINAGTFQGELVETTGTVVDVFPIDSFENHRVTIRDDAGTEFFVYIDTRTGLFPVNWPPVGSTVQVVGVLGTDDRAGNTGPRLEMRSQDDLIVLAGPPVANEIVVTPSQLTLGYVGASTIIYGTPFDGSGQPVAGFVQVYFSSSNAGVVAVDVEGRLTAVAPGTATITVTDNFSRSGTMQVTVSDAFGPRVNSGGHAYAVTNQALMWTQAQALARSTGGYLASVNDLQENGFLTNQFAGPANESLWIGLSDMNVEDLWEWTDGSPTSPGATTPGNGFAVWAGGEPNQAGDEDCVEFYNSGEWNDNLCDLQLRAIVEWPALGPTIIENVTYFMGRRYAIVRDELTWHEARNLAESLGGHLVVINDADENQFISDMYAAPLSSGFIWMGLTDIGDEGTFRWIDGTPVGYTNWDAGQPDNFEPGENCVASGPILNGAMTWNDNYCYQRFYTVIEWDYLK